MRADGALQRAIRSEARRLAFSGFPGSRAVLVIAHPGHELRVHGWLERARPRVLVPTDGSGRSGVSRLASTRRLLERADAAPGPVFGRSSDRAMYDAMLAGDIALFRTLARELSPAWTAPTTSWATRRKGTTRPTTSAGS